MPPERRLEPVSFTSLTGWNEDAVAEAWPAFLRSARAIAAQAAPLRQAVPTLEKLRDVMVAALDGTPDAARAFFEAHFTPHRIAADGFVTAYYEPCVPGALGRSDGFAAPVLARPRDLDLTNAYPDRRAIRAGAIDDRTHPVVWLRDAVEVFFIQVQGSARVTLSDGRTLRLVYDGRNGRPYTSIGKLLLERGAISLDAMSLSAVKTWLRENGAGTGGPADAIMNSNESYVFFRTEPVTDPTEGPIGGQGLPLTPFRSLAVDRTVWSYGLPFWVDATLSDGPFRRLTVAQDTGTAIVGPTRADLFFGSGDAAGHKASLVRHAATLHVLLPNGMRP